MTGTVNGLYRTELPWPRKPGQTVEQVDLATLRWEGEVLDRG